VRRAKPGYACCTFRGSMVALDIHTGQIVWKTYTMPDNGGKPGGFSGGAALAIPAVDTGGASSILPPTINIPNRVRWPTAFGGRLPNRRTGRPDVIRPMRGSTPLLRSTLILLRHSFWSTAVWRRVPQQGQRGRIRTRVRARRVRKVAMELGM
jgi:hypothetical protein